MKLNRLVAVALGSVMLMGAATAANAEALIQGVVFFGAGTPVTDFSAPGSQVSFSFEVPSSFSGPTTSAITDFSYMLNGVTVADPVQSVTFFDPGSFGMFNINFATDVVEIFGADIGSGGVITGNGFYDVTASVDGGSPPGTGAGGVTVTAAPGVPEPATWLMMAMGVGGLGFALRRRGAAAVLAA